MLLYGALSLFRTNFPRCHALLSFVTSSLASPIVSVSSEWHQAMTSLSKAMALCVFAWQPNDHCCLIRLAPSFRLEPHSASSNLKCALGGTEFALKRSFRLDFFGVRSGIVHFWNLRPRRTVTTLPPFHRAGQRFLFLCCTTLTAAVISMPRSPQRFTHPL